MSYYNNFWHIDAYENNKYPITCLFDSLCKFKNWEPAYQICFAYLVADNNVKTKQLLQRETPDFLTPDLWPPNNPDLSPVDYMICGVMQERIYGNLLIATIFNNLLWNLQSVFSFTTFNQLWLLVFY